MTSTLATTRQGAATASYITLALLMINLGHVSAQTRCLNGGTYNTVDDFCKCTPDFYGINCETSFTSSDPCTSSSIPELNDMAASHRPDNTQPCAATGCIDFSSLTVGWYRLKSPAGGFLTVGCLQERYETCGSSSSFVLVNVLQEANPNRELYSAKLALVDKTSDRIPGSPCTKSTYFPVRFLKCASYNLYFLQPTTSDLEHYCIGNKKKCGAGLTSSDGSGYEPCFNSSTCIPTLKSGAAAVLPELRQTRVLRSNGRHYDTLYHCSIQDSFESSVTEQVLYRIFYRLSYFNGTRKIIDECKFSDISIDSGGSKNVSCNSKSFLIPNSNHYGGTLECVVQAKCNSGGSDYISQELASVPHRFEFLYSLVNPETMVDDFVITPSKPIKLCINISKVPGTGQNRAEFRLSVRRRALFAKDNIEIRAYNASNANYSDLNSPNPCVITMQFALFYTNACVEFRLLNTNEEGLIPFGLDHSQLAPMVEVNVSYRSNFLKEEIEATDPWVRLQSRQLIVNIAALYAAELKEYFHVYSDPMFKPVNSETPYWSPPESDGCRILNLMRNKIIPFEVQAKECMYARFWGGHPAVVDIAIRYEYYIIRINSRDNRFSYTTRLLSGEKSALPLKSDGLPRGVTIERRDSAVRFKLDIYGTIMYFWGFMTFTPGVGQNTCFYNFIQSRASMYSFDEEKCPPMFRQLVDGYSMIDTMIIPGFYDTQNRVDGLIYRQSRDQWISSDIVTPNSERDMFSDKFVADRVVENVFTEWENLCTCSGDTAPVTSETCAISSKEQIRRTKRWSALPSIMTLSDSQAKASSSSLDPLPSAAVNITAEKAAEMCENFIRVMKTTSKAVTVAECSNSTGILGQVDYMTQFRFNCIQYAILLQTYNYTESLFNSLVSRCLVSLNYHIPTVTNRSSTLLQMQEEQCPRNCSGNGVCISGSCSCYTGFTGAACQISAASQISAQPTVVIMIDLYNTGVKCASGECNMTYLSVSPYLRTANPDCLIRSGAVGYQEQIVSEALASNIVGCSMTKVHGWLRENKKRYMALTVQLQGSNWRSNNTATFLAYQKKCLDGDTECSTNSMSCTIKNTPSTSDADTSTCNPVNSKNSGSMPALRGPPLLLTIILSAVFVMSIQFT